MTCRTPYERFSRVMDAAVFIIGAIALVFLFWLLWGIYDPHP